MQNNILKKIRLFSGKVLKRGSDMLMQDLYRRELFKDICRKNGYPVEAVSNGKLFIELDARNSVTLRTPGSDIDVFKQVVLENEYEPVIDLVNKYDIPVKNIIDCGANIGLASIVLSGAFPQAKILSLEPAPGNFQALKSNVQKNDNIIPLQNAIWKEEKTLVLGNSFRDHKEWSFNVVERDAEAGEVTVNAVTITSLMHTHNFNEIDLLKVDIEGGETEIFSKPETCAFLQKTKVIAIEIHDEFNARTRIDKVLMHYGFVAIRSGELTVGINYHYVAKEHRGTN